MEILKIYPTTKRIKTDARFLFWFFAFLFGVVGWLVINSIRQSGIEGSWEPSNPIMTLVGIIGGGWFTLYAIIETLRLHRLSEHKGPLLTFSPEGVTDHFYLKGELKWEEIKFAGCRRVKEARNHTGEYFILEPVNKGRGYYLLKPFKTPMKYQVSRLNIPTPDKSSNSKAYTHKHINKHIRDHAPKFYRRKSPSKWWAVSFWIFAGVVLVWEWGPKLMGSFFPSS